MVDTYSNPAAAPGQTREGKVLAAHNTPCAKYTVALASAKSNGAGGTVAHKHCAIKRTANTLSKIFMVFAVHLP
jgi:hypothetical protein